MADETRRKTPAPVISATPSDAGRYPRGGGARPRSTGADGSVAGRPIVMNIVVAVLLAGLVVAGWFIATQQQLLSENETRLVDADQRLVKLEERLRMTDEAMSEVGDDTNKQLNFWESEIRKLWDIGNKRNKEWIEENRAVAKKNAAALAGIEGTLRELKSSVSRQGDVTKRQQEITDQITELDLMVRRMVSQQRDLVDKVNTSSQIAASLKAGLENRVRENEQAIAAIDAYRLQVNNRINTLERRLGSP